jgi:hypothetical protein
VLLLVDPMSSVGHAYVNLLLIQLTILPSIIIHEFAHALVGKWAGLSVLGIWIGRGRTVLQTRLLGFNTEFKLLPIGGFAFFTHSLQRHLRFRYFLTILAGPASNAVVLFIALRFARWDSVDFEHSIQLWLIIILTQGFILLENLLPYRIHSAVGTFCTDGLSLFQLLFTKSPEVMRGGVNDPTRFSVTWTR